MTDSPLSIEKESDEVRGKSINDEFQDGGPPKRYMVVESLDKDSPDTIMSSEKM